MKKLLTPLVLLVAGLGVGGGAGFAAVQLLGAGTARASAHHDAPEPEFVPAGRVLAPLVDRESRLTGYVAFEVSLEVAHEKVADVAPRMPLLLHAINLRTYRTPLASGPDGMIADIEGFRRVVAAAAADAFGKGVVRRVAVTQATPA